MRKEQIVYWKEPHQRPKFSKVIVQGSAGQQESVIGRVCLELANEPIPASQKWTKDETIYSLAVHVL